MIERLWRRWSLALARRLARGNGYYVVSRERWAERQQAVREARRLTLRLHRGSGPLRRAFNIGKKVRRALEGF